jgi:capsular polysaccharide biosynthesis protein
MKTAEPPAITPPPTNDPPPLVRGVFDPPEGLAFGALRRHKKLIAIFALLGLLAGAALGLARPATYEAAATLQVGQVNPNSPGFASYTQSSSSLATAFSRAIAAAPVLATIEHKLHIAKRKASGRLSSEPIPLSPAFRVLATGPSAAEAKRLANVAAAGVIAYENRSNSANPEAASLLAAYRRASLELSEASAAVASNGGLQAKAEQSAAKIKLKAIATAYVATVGSQPPREGFISLLAGATSAKSNRHSMIQLYGFLGLLLGLLAGCGVAVLRDRRRHDSPGQLPPTGLRPRPAAS